MAAKILYFNCSDILRYVSSSFFYSHWLYLPFTKICYKQNLRAMHFLHIGRLLKLAYNLIWIITLKNEFRGLR